MINNDPIAKYFIGCLENAASLSIQIFDLLLAIGLVSLKLFLDAFTAQLFSPNIFSITIFVTTFCQLQLPSTLIL